jgi:hypothetical protein
MHGRNARTGDTEQPNSEAGEGAGACRQTYPSGSRGFMVLLLLLLLLLLQRGRLLLVPL